MTFHEDIIEEILQNKINSKQELHKAKIRFCRKYNLKRVPADSEILEKIPENISEKKYKTLLSVLRRKPMRTISGVAIVAVMTSPSSCPHGKCIPCPGGPENYTPQSYTGYEPAAMRADLNDFDPYHQVENRIEQLKAIGHPVDKIDLIIMGGTFTARLPYYQKWFIKRCFDALNQKKSKNLIEAKKINEKADSRCIGLTVETRPDWFRLQHIDRSLFLGATRVELGVQTVYDDLLYNMRRGHTIYDTVSAAKNARNAGFKICFHMMPGLPGSNKSRDIDSFK
ncbi:MAG: tRNA uridine(34) 5-carboxymethylaminomethyl modification radical SAM/GNAT enzyme Elp3, partial [Candidatus Thermoplasmatota archaeon]